MERMSEAAPHRWFGFSPKTVLIAATAIVAGNLLYVALALTSTIPYLWHWNSHAGTETVIRLYWNGQSEINEYPRTGWTLLAEFAVWSGLAATTAAAGYLVVRWVKGSGPARISLRRLSAWVCAAAILFAAAFALAEYLGR